MNFDGLLERLPSLDCVPSLDCGTGVWAREQALASVAVEFLKERGTNSGTSGFSFVKLEVLP